MNCSIKAKEFFKRATAEDEKKRKTINALKRRNIRLKKAEKHWSSVLKTCPTNGASAIYEVEDSDVDIETSDKSIQTDDHGYERNAIQSDIGENSQSSSSQTKDSSQDSVQALADRNTNQESSTKIEDQYIRNLQIYKCDRPDRNAQKNQFKQNLTNDSTNRYNSNNLINSMIGNVPRNEQVYNLTKSTPGKIYLFNFRNVGNRNTPRNVPIQTGVNALLGENIGSCTNTVNDNAPRSVVGQNLSNELFYGNLRNTLLMKYFNRNASRNLFEQRSTNTILNGGIANNFTNRMHGIMSDRHFDSCHRNCPTIQVTLERNIVGATSCNSNTCGRMFEIRSNNQPRVRNVGNGNSPRNVPMQTGMIASLSENRGSCINTVNDNAPRSVVGKNFGVETVEEETADTEIEIISEKSAQRNVEIENAQQNAFGHNSKFSGYSHIDFSLPLQKTTDKQSPANFRLLIPKNLTAKIISQKTNLNRLPESLNRDVEVLDDPINYNTSYSTCNASSSTINIPDSTNGDGVIARSVEMQIVPQTDEPSTEKKEAPADGNTNQESSTKIEDQYIRNLQIYKCDRPDRNAQKNQLKQTLTNDSKNRYNSNNLINSMIGNAPRNGQVYNLTKSTPGENNRFGFRNIGNGNTPRNIPIQTGMNASLSENRGSCINTVNDNAPRSVVGKNFGVETVEEETADTEIEIISEKSAQRNVEIENAQQSAFGHNSKFSGYSHIDLNLPLSKTKNQQSPANFRLIIPQILTAKIISQKTNLNRLPESLNRDVEVLDDPINYNTSYSTCDASSSIINIPDSTNGDEAVARSVEMQIVPQTDELSTEKKEVMNKFLSSVGVPEEWTMIDVIDLDDEHLDNLPKKVKAVLLLFPKGEQHVEHCQSEQETIDSDGQVVSDRVFFIKLESNNSSGTVSMIHAIANADEELGLAEDSPLKEFLDRTKDMSPEERGQELEMTETLCGVHDEVAKEGQTEAPEADDETNLHFITFVAVDEQLYELDAHKNVPINHGSTCMETLLKDAVAACKQFMERDPENVNFSIMALVGGGDEVEADE